MKCVLLRHSGEREEVDVDHRHIALFLNCESPTFVGAMNEIDAVAIGSNVGALNNQCNNGEWFDLPVHGDVLLVGSDADGLAMDLCLDEVNVFMDSPIAS